jgi:hypothetical protein
MQTQKEKKRYVAPAVTPLGAAVAQTLGESGGPNVEPYTFGGSTSWDI